MIWPEPVEMWEVAAVFFFSCMEKLLELFIPTGSLSSWFWTDVVYC